MIYYLQLHNLMDYITLLLAKHFRTGNGCLHCFYKQDAQSVGVEKKFYMQIKSYETKKIYI